VWSLAVTYDVTKQLQAYLRAENLFNEKYEEVASAGTPIRSIFGGVRVTFGGKS
jgi:vitamin B12 transporter